MNFRETEQSAAVMELELASATGIQQPSQDRHLQPTDRGRGPHQICQLPAPDAACNSPTPHIMSPALKDCYDR